MRATRTLRWSALAGLLAAGGPGSPGATAHAQTPAQASAATPGPVTFSRDIAPIVVRHCTSCHRPDGGAPFSLLTYADVRPRAAQMLQAIERRVMPPWKPVSGYGDFVGERRLTDEERALFRQWVDAGAREGNPSQLPHLSVPVGWRLGEPDLVVEIPGYPVESGQGDIYRNFAVPIPIAGRRYVRGVDFRPDDSSIVHHGGMRIDCTNRSRLLDERDPMPGYEGVSLDSAMNPEGYFLGWTPGQAAPLAPADLAWPLDAECDLVLELHLRPGPAAQTARARVGFYFSPSPPSRTPSLIRLGREDIDIAAGDAEHTIRDHYVLPADVEVQTVQAHAHYLAKRIRAFATLPDGSTRWLLYIDDWDFDWQDVYRYREPFWLPKGSTVVMEFTYDNSAANRRNTASPPARIRFGQRTSDEMGFLWLQVVARTPQDRGVLDEETWRQSVNQDVVGLETMARLDPGNARVHADLAYLRLQLNDVAAAEAHWREAVRIDPSLAAGHYDLGTLLMNQGKLAEALVELREAIRLDPRHSEAHNNIGSILVRQAKSEEAIGHFREALASQPANAEAHYNLARQLEERGGADEAIQHYQAAVRLKLDESDALFAARLRATLASLLSRQRRFSDALGYYEQALARDPNLVSAILDLAWILATGPPGVPPRPARAVELAERANRITAERDGYQDPLILETLALAYAAGGRRDLAIKTAEAALMMATSGARDDLAASLRARIEEWKR